LPAWSGASFVSWARSGAPSASATTRAAGPRPRGFMSPMLLRLLLVAPLRPRAGDDLLLEMAGDLLVVPHLHVVGAPPARHRRELCVVGEHLRERHLGLHDLQRPLRLHPLGPAPAAREVAHDGARILPGPRHVHP